MAAFPPDERDINTTPSGGEGPQFDAGAGEQDLLSLSFQYDNAVLDRRRAPAEEQQKFETHLELVERISKLLGPHQYVSIELPAVDGFAECCLHITRVDERDDQIIAHVVSDAFNPEGGRYTNFELCSFVDCDAVCVTEERHSDLGLSDFLDRADRFFEERNTKPLLVNVSPQGYHERESRLVYGLRDTGGQDKYIEDLSATCAEQGYRSINVNRGGPPHPVHGDVRMGMHYKKDFVDLLFIEDGSSEFVVKEQMYDTHDDDGSGTLTPRGDGHCAALARDLLRKLENEPVQILISHYADGGETTRIFREILAEQVGKDGKVPPHWHVPHSTGILKAEKLTFAEEPVPDSLRIQDRAETERRVYADARVFSTSLDITHSLVDHYGVEPAGYLFPGVNENQFHPRPSSETRTSPRYAELWNFLGEISGREVSELQNCQMVFEASRSVATKGKETVIRAFAESLDRNPGDRILVINIADPGLDSLTNGEKKHGAELRALIDELGITDRVVTTNSFSQDQVAQLCQICDVYVTGAVMETWGMSVQQAAASAVPVISSSSVPIAVELLAKERHKLDLGPGLEVEAGDSALVFQPNDYKSAGAAIAYLLDDEQQKKRESMAIAAYSHVIPRFSWKHTVRELMREYGNFS